MGDALMPFEEQFIYKITTSGASKDEQLFNVTIFAFQLLLNDPTTFACV